MILVLHHFHRDGVLALQSIFGDQVVQRGTTHPQFRRRAANVASVLGESTLNEVFLKGFTRFAEAFAWDQILAVRGVQIEIGRDDLGSLGQQHRPFDPVFEFPHVSRPTVGL